MTRAATAYTAETDSGAAGRSLGEQINQQLGGTADAVIVFASSRHHYEDFLASLHGACRPGVLVGCSSAGEFRSADRGEGAASALGLRSPDMQFAAGVGRNLSESRKAAATQITESFQFETAPGYPFGAALVLADALAGYTDELIDALSLKTAGTYQFFGGGAGDDAQFDRTYVFCGTQAYTNAAVALEIRSRKPIGVGACHGWAPAGDALRVTSVDGMRILTLNAAPAVEAFAEYAESTAQSFDPQKPIGFFLHNVLGVETPTGFKLRVPLSVNADGSVNCASDIPVGATVRIMRTSIAGGTDAAVAAVKLAKDQLGGETPSVALFFDCVATRLRMGTDFGDEMVALQHALGDVTYAGCNTYGQIARTDGQFSSFHNCTATVALFP